MRGATLRVALALVVAVALLAGLGAVAPASVAPVGITAADNHTADRPVNASAERAGDTVVVSVSDHAFDDDPQNVSVDVSLDNYDQTVSLKGQGSTSGNYQFEKRVTNLVGDAVVTEPRPSITVSYPNGSNSTQVDVRLLQFGNPGGLEPSGTFYLLPISQAIGHANDTSVPLQVAESGNAVTFDARFECSETCREGDLVVDPEKFRKTVSPLRPQEFEAYPEMGYLTTSERFDLSEARSSSFTVSESTLVIRHPLVFADDSYIIEGTTEDPQGRYVVELTASESDGLGQLNASAVVTRAGTVQVTVIHAASDETVFENEQPSLADPPEVTYDPGTKSVDFSNPSVSLPQSVETVWLNNSGHIQRFDGPTVEGQRLVLPLEDATPPFQLLIIGDRTTVRAIVPETNTGAGDRDGSQDGDQGGSSMDALLTSLLYFFVMGMVGLICIPVFGVIGREARLSLGMVAHILGVIVLLIGTVTFWQLRGEWYGVHALVAIVIVSIGLLMGSFRNFNSENLESQLINFGLTLLVFVVVLVIEILWSVPDSAAAIGSAIGGTFGAVVGLLIAANSIKTKHPVAIRLVDNRTEELVRTDENIAAHYKKSGGLTKIQVSDGTTKTTLKEGHWEFSSDADAIEGTKSKRVHGKTVVDIPVSRAGAEFRVLSMVDDSPLSDATVTLAPGDTPKEDGDILRPIGKGLHTDNLPAGVSTAAVTVTCDRYQSEERTYEDVGNNLRDTIKLAPKQGTMEVTVTLEGNPIESIPVVISAKSGIVTEETRRERTNPRGQVVESGVGVGEYDVTVDLPAEAEEFEMDDVDNPVTVTEDETTRVDVDIRFTYELSPNVHQRLDDLRDRLDSIASHPRSDVAIPTFYASVVYELLDTVEDVPRNPELFLENGYAPAATVDALLAAAEAGVEAIDEAMSSKQNVDLFAACGDMTPVDAVWGGSFDLADLFECAAQDSGRRRADIAQRLDEVDDTISQELRDLSEVRPAQDMWEQTRDMARDTTREDLEMAAITVLTLGLLDAIEALFDRQPLRERMMRTVF